MDTCGPSSALLKLKDTEFTVSDPLQDIRGLKVVDENGEEMGHIDDLLIDEKEHHVRFFQVNDGGILGFGGLITLMPIESITKIEGDVVHVCHSKECVCGAPKYDPEIKEQEFYDDIYNYYGYMPFWGAGYNYRPMPPRR